MTGQTKSRGAFPSLVLFAAMAACQREPGAPVGGGTNDVVLIQAELTGVPTNAKCVRFTSVAASSTFQQSFTVTTGDAGTTLNLTGLPYSQALTVAADAFNVACTSVVATTPITYSSDPQPAGPLAPGDTQLLSFVLKPTSNATGTVDFLYLTMSPLNANYPPTLLGQQTAPMTFTVMNIGAVATSTLAASIISNPVGSPAQFNVVTTTCNAVVASRQTCTVQVAFAPTAPGPQTATLQVTGAQGGTVSAALSGIGWNPARLTISPTGTGFPTQGLSTNSAPAMFVISNVNGGNEQPTGPISVSLPSSDFHVTTNLCMNAVLNGGASCNVFVVFSPVAVGSRNATLTVSATPGGMTSATVSGTGVSPLTVAPATVNFPSTPVNPATGPTQTVMFTNTATVASAPLSVVSANPSVFRLTTPDNCSNRAINPGASCTMTVAFFPNVVGTLSSTLTATAQTGWTAAATLQGTGL